MDKVTFLFEDIKIEVPIGSGSKDTWGAINLAQERLKANGLEMSSFCGKVEWEREICSGDYSWFTTKSEEKKINE